MIPKTPKNMQLPYATCRVLQGVDDGLTITQIAEKYKISKGTISKKVKQLTREKLLTSPYRSSFKALELTPPAKRYLKEMQQVLRVLGDATPNETLYPLKFRLHNLQFRIPIIKNNPDINKQLEDSGFKYGMKRAFTRGWEAIVDGEAVFYTPSSIQIFPKPIWAGSLDSAVQKGVWKVAGIYEKLRVMFPYLQMAVKTELCRQHLALIGGITIKIPEGFKYKSDTLLVDFSTGIAEIESINSVYAQETMRRIVSFLDDIGRGELAEAKK
jgi:transposase